MSALAPKGVVTLTELAGMASCGTPVTEEVPHSRWSLDPLPADADDLSRRVRHGSWLRDADFFDNKFFSVSPAEAAAMDPQQRLLLEGGYEALHAASLEKAAIMNCVVGVFVGISANDWADVIRATPMAKSVYSATGSAHSIASGRISFALGLLGPCVTYDTACSAALSANHAGLRAIQMNECVSGLVSGVSLMLLPGMSISFGTAGMTSPNGKCHTFDKRADGYCRAEACCSFALRTNDVKGAVTLPVLGSAVRQDGKSASLTAPSGVAQVGLLQASLADAATMAEEVGTAEAHGTGTGLGDPIEVRSLASVVLSSGDMSAPLALGSIKANVGHAEPAAGATGLLRLAMGMASGTAPPNANLRVINPHVDSALEGMPCGLPTQLAPLPSLPSITDDSAVGGVSSFGYSGTIAHCLLEAESAAAMLEVMPYPTTTLAYTRKGYGWKEAPHPLIQVRLPAPDEDTFKSRASGALAALVADHVVMGRIVFPGAGYLEMARAACLACNSHFKGATLKRAYFLAPLVLDAADGLEVRVEVDTGAERYEISSTGEEEQKVTHSAGDAGASCDSQDGCARDRKSVV